MSRRSSQDAWVPWSSLLVSGDACVVVRSDLNIPPLDDHDFSDADFVVRPPTPSPRPARALGSVLRLAEHVVRSPHPRVVCGCLAHGQAIATAAEVLDSTQANPATLSRDQLVDILTNS